MIRALAMAATAMSLLLAGPALAQAPYYQGKQVSVLVGFSPGGGTDLFGRVMADGLSKHLEGKPNVIVQNMPGAGSVVASNYFSNVAARDGSVVLVGTGQLLMRIMLGLDGAKSKVAELEALIASPMGRIAYASTKAGIKTPKDLLKPAEPLTLGVPEVISTIDAVLGLKVLKAEFRPIMGYPGKNETRLALERGEVNVDGQSTPAYLKSSLPIVKAGNAVALFAQGLMDGDKLVRDPAAPDVPTVEEVYAQIHGGPPSGSAWEAYKASVRAVGNGGKILMTHTDAPAAARAALAKAANAMATDKEFLAKAENVLEGYPLNTGEQLRATIAGIMKMDAASIAWLKDVLSRDYQMKFN